METRKHDPPQEKNEGKSLSVMLKGDPRMGLWTRSRDSLSRLRTQQISDRFTQGAELTT